jgi:hypothetical protein
MLKRHYEVLEAAHRAQAFLDARPTFFREIINSPIRSKLDAAVRDVRHCAAAMECDRIAQRLSEYRLREACRALERELHFAITVARRTLPDAQKFMPHLDGPRKRTLTILQYRANAMLRAQTSAAGATPQPALDSRSHERLAALLHRTGELQRERAASLQNKRRTAAVIAEHVRSLRNCLVILDAFVCRQIRHLPLVEEWQVARRISIQPLASSAGPEIEEAACA